MGQTAFLIIKVSYWQLEESNKSYFVSKKGQILFKYYLKKK